MGTKYAACCNLTSGLTEDLEPVMSTMRFASNRGNSHYSLKSVVKNTENPLNYPLIPDSKLPHPENFDNIRDINSMIPFCIMKTFEDDLDIRFGTEGCDLFQPVVTDMGICSSFNPMPTLEMLNPSFFTESFQKAFQEDLKLNMSVKYGEKHGKSLNFFLVMNSKQPVQDHWNAKLASKQPSTFYLDINTQDEYFQPKSSSIPIMSGYKTTISVEPMEIVGSEDLRSVEVEKRKCRFFDELGDMVLFKRYSQSACKFEKNMKMIYTYCKCVPWYIPTTMSKDYTICDVYGMLCVEKMRKKLPSNEECLPLCNQVQFTITQVLEKIDVNELCEKDVPWKTIPTHIYTYKDLNLLFMMQKIKEWNKKNTNDTYDPIKARNEFCKYMIDLNMAEVKVKFGVRKYIKTIMGLRVSFTDKLGVFGESNKIMFTTIRITSKIFHLQVGHLVYLLE